MPLVSYSPASMYSPGANMGDLSSSYVPGANMGGILGDSWDWVKKNPLIIAPPLWVAQKTLQAVPTILRSARTEVQATIAPFRPAPPPSAIDALTSGLTLGSAGAPGGEPGLSSSLPIILGAGALALVLILALGKKKKT